jgi:hypothetical protein
MPINEVLEDDFFNSKLTKYRKGREVEMATPRPSNSGRSTTPTRGADYYISKGTMPDRRVDPKLWNEVNEEKIRRSKIQAGRR